MSDCQCVRCPECGGTGNVWFEFGGEAYLGSSRSDDMDEMESCDHCHGSGTVETCERCYLLAAEDRDVN